jgi:proteasome lid subunit RPN8/RPN11|tara:strand:- start:4210 stop:4911 length:702 start_codon:yes stop_codon:yes gene_type:complete
MTWKQDALVHAKNQDPKESCGLLIDVKGKEKYYPCRNLSSYSQQCFIIDPEDYAKAEDSGKVLAVIHSHPVTPPVASQADMISCEESGLVWHIVNPKTEQWGFYKPSGYKPPLIGRHWVWGITDCWSLVRDWYKEKLGITLRDWDRPTTPEEFIENPMFEKCAWRTGFRQLRPEEKLENGDLLFMSIMATGLNHVAIFLDGDVLHHLADRISCKEPYNQWLLKCTGMRLRYAQ